MQFFGLQAAQYLLIRLAEQHYAVDLQALANRVQINAQFHQGLDMDMCFVEVFPQGIGDPAMFPESRQRRVG